MEKPLSVPANITLGYQLWPGFGKKEMIITSIVGGVAIALAIVAHIAFQTELGLCMLAVSCVCAGCAMLVQKVDNNQSVVDYITIMLRYSKEQQQFYYRHMERSALNGQGKTGR